MKLKANILLVFLLFTTLNHAFSNGEGTEKKVSSYEREISQIYSNYKDFEFPTLDNTYEEFIEAVEVYKEEKTEAGYAEIEELADKIKFFHKLKEEEKWRDEAITNRYFDLSADVYQYKRRVDNLFIEERGSGSFYGGMENHSNSVIQKKRIYEAGMLAFEKTMLEVKHTNHCDYSSRIDLLTENKRLLVKMENLLMYEDSKPLEKELKNLEDTEKIKELIFNYPID